MATTHNFVKLFEDFQEGVVDGSAINSIFYGNLTKEKHDIAYVEKDPIRDWETDRKSVV